MLYEMVVGQRPFRGETSETTRLKIIEAEPEPLPDSCMGVPPELVRIIWRCLRKKPAARFNDTRDLVVALEDLREESASGRLRQIPSAASAETIAAARRPWTRWRALLPWAFVAVLLRRGRRPGLAPWRPNTGFRDPLRRANARRRTPDLLLPARLRGIARRADARLRVWHCRGAARLVQCARSFAAVLAAA